ILATLLSPSPKIPRRNSTLFFRRPPSLSRRGTLDHSQEPAQSLCPILACATFGKTFPPPTLRAGICLLSTPSFKTLCLRWNIPAHTVFICTRSRTSTNEDSALFT